MNLQESYAELEVSYGAIQEEVEKSYKRLMKQWHPDLNKSASAGEKAKRINQAYQTIKENNFIVPSFGDSYVHMRYNYYQATPPFTTEQEVRDWARNHTTPSSINEQEVRDYIRRHGSQSSPELEALQHAIRDEFLRTIFSKQSKYFDDEEEEENEEAIDKELDKFNISLEDLLKKYSSDKEKEKTKQDKKLRWWNRTK